MSPQLNFVQPTKGNGSLDHRIPKALDHDKCSAERFRQL